MKVTEYLANQTERMAAGLAHFMATTDPEKLNWKPEMPGSEGSRSPLQQVSECVQVNLGMAKLFRGEVYNAPPGAPPDLLFADAASAQKALIDSAAELASVIRQLDDAALAKMYSHPRGEILGSNMMIMPLRNMAYHAGQINQIQMLLGDSEFHVPPNWR